jgi:hypothetical protein
MDKTNDFQKEIEKMAFELYVQRGMADGHHLDDWFRAEKIVMARHGSSGKSKTEVLMTPKRRGEPLKKERQGLV